MRSQLSSTYVKNNSSGVHRVFNDRCGLARYFPVKEELFVELDVLWALAHSHRRLYHRNDHTSIS